MVVDEARGVRQICAWVGGERLTIGEIWRRLTHAGDVTRTGKTVWDRSGGGDPEAAGLDGGRGLWQDPPGTPAAPSAGPAGSSGPPAAGGVGQRWARRGVDDDRRAGDGGACWMCGSARTAAEQPAPRPALPPGCPLSVARLGAVSAVWRRVRRDTREPAGRQRASKDLGGLPMSRHRCLPCWGRARR